MRYVLVIVLALSFAACKQMPSVADSRLTNEQLIGTFQGVKTLPLSLVNQCDRRIRDYYISGYQKPYTWRKAITQTPMDETNLYILNSHPSISRRVGFDVSRMVLFATRYRGRNAADLPDVTDFICVYEHTGDKQLVFKAVYSDDQFESAWGIDAIAPAQWGGPLR